MPSNFRIFYRLHQVNQPLFEPFDHMSLTTSAICGQDIGGLACFGYFLVAKNWNRKQIPQQIMVDYAW